MYDFIYQFIVENRYASIFALMFFFPNESVMPIVGYVASLGNVSLAIGIVFGMAGSTVGSVVIYWIARLIDQQAVYELIKKHGKWMGLNLRNTERAGKWFDHNAKATVLIGKCIPGIRSAVSITAGFRRMPFLAFFVYTLLGTAISSTLLALIGYSVQMHFASLASVITNIAWLLTAVLAVGVIVYISRRHHH